MRIELFLFMSAACLVQLYILLYVLAKFLITSLSITQTLLDENKGKAQIIYLCEVSQSL